MSVCLPNGESLLLRYLLYQRKQYVTVSKMPIEPVTMIITIVQVVNLIKQGKNTLIKRYCTFSQDISLSRRLKSPMIKNPMIYVKSNNLHRNLLMKEIISLGNVCKR